MSRHLTRRAFLHETIATSAASFVLPLVADAAQTTDEYEVLLLGDVHFDRLSHHDMTWLEREKPNDVRQVQNYSRLTAEVWPHTLDRVRTAVAGARGSAPVALVAHIGDFVEGLCGTPALAEAQCREAIASVHDAKLGAPFVFCKGNHDITGPGAPDAFDRVLKPFLIAQAQAGGPKAVCFDVDQANVAIAYGRDWFLFSMLTIIRAPSTGLRVCSRRGPRGMYSCWCIRPSSRMALGPHGRCTRDQRMRLNANNCSRCSGSTVLSF